MQPHAPPLLTDDELLRYTGQTAVRDVSTAAKLAAQADEALRSASWQLRRHTLSFPSILLRYVALTLSTGSDHADAIILGAFLALPPTILLAWLFKPPLLAGLTLCLIAAGFLYRLVYAALKTQPDEQGHDRRAIRAERFRSFFRHRAMLLATRTALAEDLQRRVWVLAQLRAADEKAEEVAALLATDLRAMTGLEFEHFLERVFRLRGYREVYRTRASCDQGVDLIVGDGRERVAIRVKLHQGPVGNDAVQQVFAGMVHYGCQRCAVITNSGFTLAAIELAASTNCRLIDGQGLRRVIAGTDCV
jgi:HJR/Mrr/RecB family endonuclease